MRIFAGCLLLSCAILVASKVTYDGQKVLSVKVHSVPQLNALKQILEETGDTDVWSHDSNLVIGDNHIRVTNVTTVQLLQRSLDYDVYIEDIQKLIDENEQAHSISMANKTVGSFFDNYRRYVEIVAELKRLASAYPNLAKFIPTIGSSIEGRDIPAIILSAKGFADPKAKRIYWQGGQHAREWIAPATVMYLITKFLDQYGKDTTITHLLNNLEFVIVPLCNPDGYEWAHTNERLWRKNRRKNTGGSFGVDLNRNWNDHWGGEGSSGIPTSDIYRGTAPFSEPESLALSKYITGIDQYDNVLGGIDFHCYSQLVLRPYGWSTARSPDETALKIIGDGVSYEIQRNSGLIYTSQRAVDLYVACGGAADWFYLEGIWAAYTLELRDTGRYGFLLPPAQIVPTGEEIYASMRYFANTVLDSHP